MEAKVGCYICKGCDIGKSLDIDKLIETAGELKPAVCKSHDLLCSAEGVEMIRKDIESDGLNRVCVCACSNRVFPELFDFGTDIFTDRANLREWVVWTHPANDEDTQMLAEDYIRMSITKVQKGEPPVPFTEETSRDIMVIGGGMSGMTSAKAAADAGYKVTLVEKEDHLGGWATKFTKVFPKRPPYKELEGTGVEDLIGQVESHENITIHKSTVVKKTDGQPGKFMVTLTSNGSTSELQVGSIVLSAGWRPYDASKLTHLGYGSTPDVITNIQMEEMVLNGELKRPSNGRPIESIAFIQCAGSRDQDHLPYCSAVCCRVSLKQAMYVREKYPDAKIYIIYKDVRTPQQFELFYANVQNDNGVFLTKGEIASVSNGSGGLKIDVTDTLFGEDIQVQADMVVLATGMVPATKVEDIQAPAEGEVSGADADGEKKAAEAAEPGAKIINLTYRQGTDLPTLKYGYTDSHFICFPY
ncbi:MAG: FAD-dependent oxidoreductase, partial [candidate division Zixibacteria bacterium]|nr:FAD-dependent oxidoreductase [candidate division Zixibacteria bacterium]MBU1471858.1 FAD-dependent oxidoreductase [candidate division Zixibacteria bacterium]